MSLSLRLALGCLFSLVVACGGAAVPKTREPVEISEPAKPARARRAPPPAIAPTQIVFSLRGYEQEFDDCARGAAGIVRVSWRVTGAGSTRRAKVVGSTLDDESAVECVRRRVEALKFPSTGRSSSARWTFVFGLEQSERAEQSPAKNRRRRRAGKRRAAEPGVAIEAASPGFLDPARIEGVVQSGFGLYGHCYRDGLSRDPRLGGAVRLKLVIDPSGSVERISDGGSDLPDRRVINCVAQGLFALEFPKPERGSVHVLYRMLFDAS